ncbi:MAG: hypothetical protein RMZ41_003170 [Nostoc sp. DedVER02]|uniref:hypothetical protein n=1 Tax=unclassified Nostoc TaxID=2593658 RepID=UPI002AD25D0D|nr:hypothetical protein [Nostoc sp. DedVER02]MDZ7986843.1 hypothetical protein [Nostoc sp. DedVER02]MDZ8115745.1 hypothetical protein [Nostoc sp. DedVER01b]
MSLNLDELKKLVDDFKQQPEPIPCGVVFRLALKEAIMNHFPKADDRGCLPIIGLPIYFDAQQQEDCLVFEDRELLIAYLNRDKDPQAWAMQLVKHLPNQLSFDEPLPPRIPEMPPIDIG